MPTATQPQMRFLNDLLEQGDRGGWLPADHLEQARLQIEEGLVDSGRASRYISRLLELRPEGNRVAQVNHAVPEGRYAIRQDDGSTKFYLVDRPTEGRWAGMTFVKHLVACGGYGEYEFRKHRIRGAEATAVLAAIELNGVLESMKLFGHELGHCGRCGRNLTNDLSRELGIGPVCRRELAG